MSDDAPASDRARLGRFLESHETELVRRWCEAVSNAAPELADLPHVSLVDAMGLFVEQVAMALQREMPLGHSNIARHHGEHRDAISVSLHALVREYALFVDVVRVLANEEAESFGVDTWLELARHAVFGASAAAHAYAVHHERETRRRDFEHFAFLAHDLRNPLASIRFAWQLMIEAAELPDNDRVRLIDRALDRMVEQLDASLRAARARLAPSRDPVTTEPVDLAALVQVACRDLSLDAESRQVRVELEGVAPTWVEANSSLLSAAVVNVLHNAIKHSPPGEAITLTVSSSHENAMVEICDRGPGISPDLAERMYTAFQQGRAQASGFGLGLAIVQQAMDAHRGSVHVENRPAAGCCVQLLLPRTRSDPAT